MSRRIDIVGMERENVGYNGLVNSSLLVTTDASGVGLTLYNNSAKLIQRH